ncbi:Vacuolar inheritance and morphology protein, partial [Teratosphaeriaceae sp. CCFEE 6253]
MESAEPGGGTGAAAAAAAAAGQKRGPSQPARQTSSPSASVPPLRRQRSTNLVPISSPSTGLSPRSSRNASPIRRDSRPQPLGASISTQPSAAAIQRALSAASVPQLPTTGPVTDAVSRLPRVSKGSGSGSGETTPQWPVSPRLKSPPPSAASSRRGSAPAQPRKVDSMPSISVQSATPQSSTPPPSKISKEEPKRVEQQLQAPSKPASRGPSGKSTLETVQENSADTIAEPAAAVQAAADLKPLTKIAEEDKASSAKREGPEPEKHTQP